MTPPVRGAALMFGFVVLWTAVEVAAAGLLARYSPWQVVFTRYAVHVALVLMIWGWRAALTTKRPVYQVVRSLLMVGMPGSWVAGMAMGVEGAVISALWTTPLLVLAFSRLLLGERSGPIAWIAAAVGAVGAGQAFASGPLPSGLEWLPVMGMAGSLALYIAMTRSLRDEPLGANLFYTAAGVLVALAPFAPGFLIAPAASDLPLFGAVGAMGLATLWFVDRAAAASPFEATATVILLQAPMTIALAWLAGHVFYSLPLAGGLAIAAIAALTPLATVMIQTERRRIR